MTLPDFLKFLIFALAAWRTTRLLIEDVILEPLRERFWAKWPPESTKLGYLSTCYWCLGLWVAVIWGLVFWFGGSIGLLIAVIFAFSALIGLIQSLSER